MNNETDTRKLLELRATIEAKIKELQQEITDLQTATVELDKLIVNQGFRTPAPIQPKPKPVPQPEASDDGTSITAKDGTVLGKIIVEGRNITFKLSQEYEFTEDIPPFRSFLLERVLDNMKSTDGERAANGEISAEEILDYTLNLEDTRIIDLVITNFGGERRLREINSSLRWTFDKMYDKIRQE
jgi:hypothetical protein